MIKTKEYWENRYYSGGNSGNGSYGDEALFKSEYINNLIKNKNIKIINDFGCGDSNQISLINGFEKYYGYDVSKTAINICQKRFVKELNFLFTNSIDDLNRKADLCLSLDVTYHIVEQNLFEIYIKNLFDYSKQYVLIYSVNEDNNKYSSEHVYHRLFVEWIEKNITDFNLIDISGYSKKDNKVKFYLYEKKY